MEFKKKLKEFVGIIQKVIITFLLFFLYLFAFGAMFLFMKAFRINLGCSGRSGAASFWEKAKGYCSGMDESMRGS
jgi:hypothetical protein